MQTSLMLLWGCMEVNTLPCEYRQKTEGTRKYCGKTVFKCCDCIGHFIVWNTILLYCFLRNTNKTEFLISVQFQDGSSQHHRCHTKSIMTTCSKKKINKPSQNDYLVMPWACSRPPNLSESNHGLYVWVEQISLGNLQCFYSRFL